MAAVKPVLGITLGDPAGVGPEITLKALAEQDIYDLCRPLVIGDSRILEQALAFSGTNLRIRPVDGPRYAHFDHGAVDVYDLKNVDMNDFQIGQISSLSGHAAFEYIKQAIDLALAGEIDGTVTNPIHKESLHLAGYPFSGHTEIYAHFTGTKDVTMLLVGSNLRIAHVTTHVSLRDACDLIKKGRILKVIQLTDNACRQFGIAFPRIGVAGLNPHSSDGGLFGSEEAEEIIPAIEEARALGLDVEGPVPPDIIFSKARGGFYDGCVAMYHDQGHIPFKMETFQWNQDSQAMPSIRGVNVTLGLPIIRTSVDHGTALDIAGKGYASPEALLDAIRIARDMAVNRIKGRHAGEE